MIEVKVPSPGESITEVEIANWLVKSGDYVEKDQEICEIDSDKATLTINAEESGEIDIVVNEGEMVPVNSIICKIDSTKVSQNKSTSKNDVNESVLILPKKENLNNVVSEPSPAAKKMIRESGLENIKGTGKDGRITKQDVLKSAIAMGNGPGKRNSTRKKLSSLKEKVSKQISKCKK